MLDEFHQTAQSYIPEDGTLYIYVSLNPLFCGIVSIAAYRIFIYIISNTINDEFETWTKMTSERGCFARRVDL
jgi:hypothetical protein